MSFFKQHQTHGVIKMPLSNYYFSGYQTSPNRKTIYICNMMNLKKHFSLQAITIFAFLLLAFSVPFYKKLIVPVSALVLLLFLLQMKRQHIVQRFMRSKLLILLVLYYLFIVLSLFWTTNLDEGFFDLEVKFSFIGFPVIFLLFPFHYTKEFRKKILTSFLYGIFAGMLICLIHAARSYINEPVIYYTFVSSRLSLLHHPTYYALFLNLALIILFERLRSHEISLLPSLLLIFSLLFFSWLLMSRSGIITNALILIAYWTGLFFRRKYIPAVMIFVFVLLSFFAVFRYSNYTMIRLATVLPFLNDLFDRESFEKSESGSDSRLITWQAAWHAVKENPVMGKGTGDVHDALNEYYQMNNHTTALERELNAHNQFLQSWVAAGLGAFILLFMMLLSGVYKSVLIKDNIMLGFFIITPITMMIESIFETQSGVVFYCFFACFWFIQKEIMPEKQENSLSA